MKDRKEVQKVLENLSFTCKRRLKICNSIIQHEINVDLMELKKLIDRQPDCDSTFMELREALANSTIRENNARSTIDSLQSLLQEKSILLDTAKKLIKDQEATIINLHDLKESLCTKLHITEKATRDLQEKLYAANTAQVDLHQRIQSDKVIMRNLRTQIEAVVAQNYCTFCGNLLDGYVPPVSKDKGGGKWAMKRGAWAMIIDDPITPNDFPKHPNCRCMILPVKPKPSPEEILQEICDKLNAKAQQRFISSIVQIIKDM